MQPTLTIDTRAFSSVLKEYSRHSRKDWADIVNTKSLDVAFRALPETPKADKADIKNLTAKPWWNRYVSKRIRGGVKFKVKKNKVLSEFTIQGDNPRVEEMRRVSKLIIAARARSIAFVKSGWLPAIRKLWPLARDKAYVRKSEAGSRQYGVDKGSARPAVPGDHPTAFIINSAIGIEKIGVGPLQRAVDASAADMGVYIARKLEERARRVAR